MEYKSLIACEHSSTHCICVSADIKLVAAYVFYRHGALRSACWSENGDKLYVATKCTIWVFNWSSIDTTIKDFTFDETSLDGLV